MDPAGVVNRSLLNAAGRAVCTIQNYVAATACDSSGQLQPGESENVVTQMAYNADGNLLRLTAKNPSTGDQNTLYAYGTTLEDSGIASNALLRAEIYPDTADGQDQVTYSYNRQGQVTEKIDQNGTVHQYVRDKLGRQIDDKVVTLASGVDDAVQRISQTFEVRGMVEKITSHNAPTAGSVVNEVENEYNDFAQLETQYQEYGGEVDTGSSVKVEYDYADGSENTIRPELVKYPNGRELEYLYDNPAADKLSRVRTLRWDGTNVCRYGYLGLGAFVEVDYLQPNVQYTLATGPANSYSGLDRFGRIVDLLWRHNSTPLAHLEYGYDRVSNRTFRKDNVARSYGKPFDELYEYDRLHRLKKFHRGLLVEDNQAIESPALQQGWMLDATGNWRNFTQNDQQDPAKTLDQQRIHNQVNEITEIARTIGQNWTTPQYDKSGNMVVIPQPKQMDKTYQATWDAWNRLVKLEQEEESHSSSSSSSSTSSSSSSSSSGNLAFVAAYAYNGLNWRIKNTTPEETRHFYYSSAWQCLEERIDGQSGSSSSSSSSSGITADRQYVWGLRYIDDLVCRDRDTNANATLDERLYALQDAHWNVVAVAGVSADVLLRIAYSAYGASHLLNEDFTGPYSDSLADWEYRFTGRMENLQTGVHDFRLRPYHYILGRFISRDLIGYADGPSLYGYGRANPLRYLDAWGLETVIDATASTEYYETEGGAAALATISAATKWGWWGLAAIAAASYYYFKWGKDSRKLNNNYKGNIGNCPPCALIWIHGFHNDFNEARRIFIDVERDYKRAGGQAEIYGFAWNAKPGPTFFYAGRRAADQVGKGAFAAFLNDFVKKCPDTVIHLGAHSLGNRVLLQGVNEVKRRFPSALLVAAAVDNESLEPGQEFGAVPGLIGNVYVAFNPEDDILFLYAVSELDSALGKTGSENSNLLPRNVHQRNFIKDFGDDHGGVYDPQKNVNFWKHYVPCLKCP